MVPQCATRDEYLKAFPTSKGVAAVLCVNANCHIFSIGEAFNAIPNIVCLQQVVVKETLTVEEPSTQRA